MIRQKHLQLHCIRKQLKNIYLFGRLWDFYGDAKIKKRKKANHARMNQLVLRINEKKETWKKKNLIVQLTNLSMK